MKLSSFYPDIRFKQVFQNSTTDRSPNCRSVVKSNSCELHLPLNDSVPADSQERLDYNQTIAVTLWQFRMEPILILMFLMRKT